MRKAIAVLLLALALAAPAPTHAISDPDPTIWSQVDWSWLGRAGKKLREWVDDIGGPSGPSVWRTGGGRGACKQVDPLPADTAVVGCWRVEAR